MKKIEYKIVYAGTVVRGDEVEGDPYEEIVSFLARDINSGFTAAMRWAKQPLGNGRRRQLHSIEFWKVV